MKALRLVCGMWRVACGMAEDGGWRLVYDCKGLVQEVAATECLQSSIAIRFLGLT